MKVWWVCFSALEGHFGNGSETHCRYGFDGSHDSRCGEMQLVPADIRMVSGELQCPSCKFVYEVAT